MAFVTHRWHLDKRLHLALQGRNPWRLCRDICDGGAWITNGAGIRWTIARDWIDGVVMHESFDSGDRAWYQWWCQFRHNCRHGT